MNKITCDVCDDEGYIPCEECNADIVRVKKREKTPHEVHLEEVGYWAMVKQEFEMFNLQVREGVK